MSESVLNTVVLLLPLLVGGVIAALNATSVNDFTERAESKVRQWHSRATAASSIWARYVLRPPLWSVCRFCTWTDTFENRGVKNGARVAATLYLVGLWLLVIYFAALAAIAIAMLVGVLYVIVQVLSSSSDSSETATARSAGSSDEEEVMARVGLRGKRVYTGTNWFNEELRGRVDDDGHIYRGTNWHNEERIGRIDDEGNIFKGTNWMNEEMVGRIDEDGSLYKGTNWFNEEQTGRVDEDGSIYDGTNWFNEKKRGRTGE